MRSICRRALVGCALAAAIALMPARPLGAQLTATLSPQDVRAAIAWGNSGEAAPYPLHHRSPDPAKVNPVIVGVIYTPFVRVALAAKQAHDAFRDFGEQDVTPSIVEPLAYVALRWYCCDPDHGHDLEHFHPLVPFDYKVAVAGQDRFTESYLRLDGMQLLPPAWVKRAAAMRSRLGGSLPYDDIVLVAAYPMANISAGTDFVIYRDDLTPGVSGFPTRNIRNGRVTAADIAAWK
jgi:hypothetical protein